MTLPAPPTGLYPEDYERIEEAVMETVRGRWFLLEFARRQRAEETERLVLAVDRLERVAARAEEQEAAVDWRLPRRLVERAQEFAQTLRASGVEEPLCAQADALVAQFSRLLDTPAAEREEPPRAIAEAAPVDIVADYVEIAEPPVEPLVLEPVAAEEQAEIEQAEVEQAEIEHAEICAEPFTIEAEPEIDLVLEEPAPLGEEPPFVKAAEAPVAEPPAANGIVFEEFVARAILPDAMTPPKAAPSRPVDPRLVALSRLDHLPLNEKLRLFG
ncbi:hypothetical+protein [Methylocapsa aurea]|uniref:hypothetical protein n=1 Tax=Methylocapsa aurea TaxID=663610 RepID=UPI003D188C5C